jgi:hypothetical protein
MRATGIDVLGTRETVKQFTAKLQIFVYYPYGYTPIAGKRMLFLSSP